jgi:uncharacterized protein (TIGR02996 family)
VGYSTDFAGQFDCYRVESTEMGTFLRAVYEGDYTVVGVFADWLTERGDPRGEQLARVRIVTPEDKLAFWRFFGLRFEHAAYLTAFNETRRMKRDPAKAALLPDPVRLAVGLSVGEDGAYFVGGRGFHGQDDDESILDHNSPPGDQPGLWCQWRPSEDGTAIVWDGGEKFYDYVEWLEYLILHFLNPWAYVLNGKVRWQGEVNEDRGVITVINNRVLAEPSADSPTEL